MIVDEIIADLKSTSAAPTAALSAGVVHADGLAAVIYPIADKFRNGVYLLPTDTELLLNGLHLLAAARHAGLCERVTAAGAMIGSR